MKYLLLSIILCSLILLIIPASAIFTLNSIDINATSADASTLTVYFNLYGPSLTGDVQNQIMNDFAAFTPSYTSMSRGSMIFNLHNFVSVDSNTTYNETYYQTVSVYLSNSSIVPVEMTITFPDNKYTYHFYRSTILPSTYYKTPNTKISTYDTPSRTMRKTIAPTPKPTLMTTHIPAPAITPTAVPSIAKPSAPTPIPSLAIMQPSDLLPKTIPGFEAVLTIIGLVGSLIIFAKLR